MRNYFLFKQSEIVFERWKLVPIRDQDKYSIMNWRNEQIEVLRQKSPLTKEGQERYFQTVVDALFKVETPDQLLFSFLEDDVLVGYGGLVHIDWASRNGEISFLTETKRATAPEQLKKDWVVYLRMLKTLVDANLGFAKIYTYAYDLRPMLFEALKESAFVEEARLKRHIHVGDRLVDVLIHSFHFEPIELRRATRDDVTLYYDWANDPSVRQNSFNQQAIEWKDHQAWFLRKIESPSTVMLVICVDGVPAGQIRFDELDRETSQIGFSVAAQFRGRNLGRRLLQLGVQWLLREKPVTRTITGDVKDSNEASARAFVSANFQTARKANGVTTFEMKRINN